MSTHLPVAFLSYLTQNLMKKPYVWPGGVQNLSDHFTSILQVLFVASWTESVVVTWWSWGRWLTTFCWRYWHDRLINVWWFGGAVTSPEPDCEGNKPSQDRFSGTVHACIPFSVFCFGFTAWNLGNCKAITWLQWWNPKLDVTKRFLQLIYQKMPKTRAWSFQTSITLILQWSPFYKNQSILP